MIIQCEACQTRFRLADEKIKPGGTKVRCSKCKEVFTVTPPEPEPVAEAVDFGSFNMEEVTEDTSAEEAPASESLHSDSSNPAERLAPPTPEENSESEETEPSDHSELDFSALETEMDKSAGLRTELADDFSFADTSQPVKSEAAEENTPSQNSDFAEDQLQAEPDEEEQDDFGVAFAGTEGTEGPVEFDFNEDSESDVEATQITETESPAEDAIESSDFSFESDEEVQESNMESSVSDEGDDNAFSFDDSADETLPDASEEDGRTDDFSFDDESTPDEESASGWDDEPSADDTPFDFEQPQFDIDDSPAERSASNAEDEGLQFGEIDFSGDSDESIATGFETENGFSKATIEKKEEPEPFSQSRQSPPPSSRDYDEEPLVPSPPKKSSLSRILMLLVILLIILGGAAGYLYMQEGSLNLHTIARYLPFLQEYIGEDPASIQGDRIDISINGTSYVNGQAGQMLVIQGTAVNNNPTTRSAITVKGVLLDAKGKTLLQQTIFCGNKLEEAALKTLSFKAIEEAMNNQFGDRLSNMNVAAGEAIPFTLVFRNLPEGVANINVEVVDSKPGAG